MSEHIEKSEPAKEPPFGSAGGLYYPSDGAHGLAAFLGLDGIGRAALHAELRECYVLAKREAEESSADKYVQQGREEAFAEVESLMRKAARHPLRGHAHVFLPRDSEDDWLVSGVDGNGEGESFIAALRATAGGEE